MKGTLHYDNQTWAISSAVQVFCGILNKDFIEKYI
jgi:hypothetical protein